MRLFKQAMQPIVALILLSQGGATWGFPWDKDMVDQPTAKPQKSEAPAGPNSIPVEGGETLPAPAITDELAMFEAKENAVSVQNPVPATEESIARGEYLFQLNCLVCHGADGTGTGPVGAILATAPVDLNDAYTQDQADGQLFFTLTRGRATMPYYRDALTQQERWDVINYVRAAFGSAE